MLKLIFVSNRLTPSYMQEYDFEWAETLSICKFKGRVGEPDYDFTLDLIRNACDKSFVIGGNANCRLTKRSMAIYQVKPLPWEYLYQCIKMSKKDFHVMLPDGIESKIFEGKEKVYAWYNEEINAVECFEYTGKIEVEEDTSPGYDGYGRFDKEYEIIQGAIDKNGRWKIKPYKSWAYLYSMPQLK